MRCARGLTKTGTFPRFEIKAKRFRDIRQGAGGSDIVNAGYDVIVLSAEEEGRLRRVYADLLELAGCQVPAVRAAARAALSHVAQALNGEGLAYELYTKALEERD